MALLIGVSAQAQQIMEGTGEVRNLVSTREGEMVKVEMDIDISQLEVGLDETLVLTPVVERSGNQVALPSVEIMGRRAYLYHLRNDEFTATADPFYAEREAKRAERKAGQKQLVEYSAQVKFEEWMRGATVLIKESSCGCKPEALALGDSGVGRFLHEIYAPNYLWTFLEPEPEPVKVRDLTLSAYINFKVDKYDILEDYKDNGRELHSVLNSISRVGQDEDLTITHITIEGWASPEAPEAHNLSLSQNRADALADYVSQKSGINRAAIGAIGRGEDWAGLRHAVEATPMLLNRNQVLAIINDEQMELDAKDEALKGLEPTTIYERLMNEMYPRLRRNDYHIVYNVRNFNLEEARGLVDSDPRKLSVGELYKVAGSYEKGSKEYNHVMEVAAQTYPEVVAATVNAAAVKMQSELYDEALSILMRGDLDDERILSALGNVYAAQQQYIKAREMWQRAADKGNADAAHNLSELNKYLASL